MHKERINTIGQKILTVRFLNQNYNSGGVNVHFSCHPLINVHLFTLITIIFCVLRTYQEREKHKILYHSEHRL